MPLLSQGTSQIENLFQFDACRHFCDNLYTRVPEHPDDGYFFLFFLDSLKMKISPYDSEYLIIGFGVSQVLMVMTGLFRRRSTTPKSYGNPINCFNSKKGYSGLGVCSVFFGNFIFNMVRL
jgi:hypothetical protein